MTPRCSPPERGIWLKCTFLGRWAKTPKLKLILPRTLVIVIGAFAPLFSKRVLEYAKLLVVGAILAPEKRTVTAVLRVKGNADHSYFPSWMGEC